MGVHQQSRISNRRRYDAVQEGVNGIFGPGTGVGVEACGGGHCDGLTRLWEMPVLVEVLPFPDQPGTAVDPTSPIRPAMPVPHLALVQSRPEIPSLHAHDSMGCANGEYGGKAVLPPLSNVL